MSKHDRRILLNNLRGKLSLLMKLGQFMSYSKGNNFIKKFSKNSKNSPKKLKHNLKLTTMKFLKKSTYIRYVIAKLSKLVQIKCWPPQIPFYRDSFENSKKKGVELVSRPLFYRIFYEKIYFVILHKLAKFHHQTVYSSQAIS